MLLQNLPLTKSNRSRSHFIIALNIVFLQNSDNELLSDTQLIANIMWRKSSQRSIITTNPTTTAAKRVHLVRLLGEFRSIVIGIDHFYDDDH